MAVEGGVVVEPVPSNRIARVVTHTITPSMTIVEIART